MRNRDLAEKANILVCNHHLFSLQTKKTAAEGPIYVLADEAHELPKVDRAASAVTYTSERWSTTLSRINKSADISDPDDPRLPLLEALSKIDPIREMETFFGSPSKEGVFLCPETEVGELTAYLKDLRRKVDKLARLTDGFRDERTGIFRDRVHREVRVWESMQQGLTGKDTKLLFVRETDRFGGLMPGYLQLQPLRADLRSVDAHFSATLRYAGSYDPYLREAGLVTVGPPPPPAQPPRKFTTKSPFSWARQALVVLPGNGVDPSLPRDKYDQDLSRMAVDISHRMGGRTLFCCTSWSSVKAVSEALRAQTCHQVLVQGERSKSSLIEAFKEDVTSVLVGTLSMWTGVDVPGEALSCLVIDKIPFRGGVDPWLEARKATEPEWFQKLILPEAGTLLAQGFGRLIRSTSDIGVCVVLDPRMYPGNPLCKGYGPALFHTMFPEDCNFSDTLEDIPPFLEWASSQG